MKIRILRLFLLSLFGITIVACNARDLTDDPLDEGIQKIDERRYDEAIQFLSDLNRRDSRPEVRIALASAYVGRSGVEFVDYWEVVKSAQTDPITNERIMENPQYIKNQKRIDPIRVLLPSQTQSDLDLLFQKVSTLELYRDRIETLPYVPKETRSDLQNGIDILDQIPTPGGRFYRSVLIVTLLRSNLDDGFDVWESIESNLQRALTYPLEAPRIFCSPLTGDFVGWLLTQMSYAETAAEDLKVAFPSDAQDFDNFSKSILQQQEDIPSLQANLVPEGCS